MFTFRRRPEPAELRAIRTQLEELTLRVGDLDERLVRVVGRVAARIARAGRAEAVEGDAAETKDALRSRVLGLRRGGP